MEPIREKANNSQRKKGQKDFELKISRECDKGEM